MAQHGTERPLTGLGTASHRAVEYRQGERVTRYAKSYQTWTIGDYLKRERYKIVTKGLEKRISIS